LQWELGANDFQHAVYPRLATQKSLELAAAIAGPNADQLAVDSYQVNPPYTPKVRQLSVDYSSSVEFSLRDPDRASAAERVYHLRPWGGHEIQPEEGELDCRFLPHYAHEGALYLGIRNVRAPQQLTLLFQLAEGSADPSLTPVPVEWSYLSGDRWRSLHDGSLRRDTTRGLINSGLVELDLPSAQASVQLPGELYWLRVAIARQPRSVCDTVAIKTQAALAIYVDEDADPHHYDQPLAPGTITTLAAPDSAIAGVSQPYTSFDGAPREAPGAFYTRVSERLRHKNRAVTIWDYERLILDRFPRLYKVKCVPADAGAHPDEPGRVDIIVIPDIRNQLPFDPFAPMASAELLADVEAFARASGPAWADVHVRNPRYLSLKTRFGVRFKPGHDIGYCKRRLNEELGRFLSPWAYDEGADIVIGEKIYATSIVNFVDKRDYVDYIASIRLFRSADGRDYELVLAPTGAARAQGYFVTTDRPGGVLVAAREHEIDVISAREYTEEHYTGINYMKVELDFVVG
jgi:hypothetical protein